MSVKRILILGLLLTAALGRAQTNTSEGWFNMAVFATNGTTSIDTAPAPGSPPPGSSGGGSVGYAEAVTPEIQALARGLENDPKRIFDYVHDHIRHVLYYGSKKGAQLTLLERSGNDFDQCALLVALLNAAGYTNTGYQFGMAEMPYDSPDQNDVHHWLGLSLVNTVWSTTSAYLLQLLTARGYPTNAIFTSYDHSDTNTMFFQRIWATLSVGGTNYLLDPAFKPLMPITNLVNLAAAMNLSSNGVWSAAGGTDTANYAQGLTEATLRGALTTGTTNLLNYLQTNCPNATVQQVIGGQQVVSSAGSPLTTTLPYTIYTTNSGYALMTWTTQPTSFMSGLAVSFAGTNQTWFTPQLQGQRLSLTFNSNGLAQLWLEDSLVLQTTNTGSGTSINVALSATHPYGSWDKSALVPVDQGIFDQTPAPKAYQRVNASYGLVYAFEASPDWLQERQQKLDAYRQQGYSDTSRQVVTETLNVMGLNWMMQTELNDQLIGAQGDILPQNHHRFGRMAQEGGGGYYIDIYLQNAGVFPKTGAALADQQKCFAANDIKDYFASALEHGIIEQLQSSNLVAASTMKLLQLANTNGQPVYLASASNWNTGAKVRNSLTSYATSTLTNLDALIGAGYLFLLPQSGAISLGATHHWSGDAYVEVLPGSASRFIGMFIGGTYSGGYVDDLTALPDPTTVSSFGDVQPVTATAAPVSTADPLTADPVDTANGTFQVESTDLSLGQAEPRGITLSRYYNSRRRYLNPAGMAGGWVHNYAVNATESPAPQAALGGTTPAQMAPMVVATCAALNFYNTQPDAKNWLTTALIAKWGVDQLIKNGVSISLGKDTLQFVKQPDGRFTPPANCTWTLARSNSAYSLLQRHGNTFKFDATGRLTNIVDQYSQSLRVTYGTGALSNRVATVIDWKGRTFTFGYTSNQLTSVSDGTRSVGYGYGANSDLTAFTDPEGKISNFVYDTNHQIVATFDALGQMVSSNVFDGFGRVTTQCSQGDTNKAWQIYWSGWQTVSQDPAGGKTRYFYDDKTRLIAQQDALGNLSQSVYDGQDHVVMTVSPLNETNRVIYDGNNNVLATIDPLGFSNQFFYDGQFNLVRTLDARGNPATLGYNTNFSVTGSTNGTGDWTAYTYNTDGTLATRVDAGGTTSYSYDSTYRQLSSITYPGSLGGEGFLNSGFGDVLSHTNARGYVTSFQYNSRRQLTNTIAPASLTASASFDAVGNLQSSTDARGFVTTSFWSPTRHSLGTALPATPQGTPATTNFYDGRDWLVKTLDPLQQPSLFTNDLAGRLVSATDPLLRTVTFGLDADGHKIATTNAAQEVTRQQWSARGEPVNTIDNTNHTILRAFDGAGNQILLTNRNGKTWQFYFDAANRLTNTITPLGRSSSVVFNNRGLVASTKDAAGQTTSLYYDARGRLTNRVDGVASTLFNLDGNNNLTNIVENGRTNSWSFDAYDRVSSYQDADGNLIQYRYDNNGNITNLIYPGGKIVAYFFDSLNRLTNVTDWVGRKTALTYDLASRLTSITRPNGTLRTIGYDAAGETTNITEQAASKYPLAFFKLHWDRAARVDWEFAGPLPHAYTLPTRNMTNDSDNRLITFNNLSISNDLNGNMVSGPLTNNSLATYTFDSRNRLTSAGGLSCGYDPAGNRTTVTNGAMVTKFVINPNAKLPQTLMRIKNGVTNYYIYGVGLLYQITETAAATNTLTYHFDYRGSTVALTDDNGNITDHIEYSAYASVTYRLGTNDTPFLYNGRYGVMTDSNGLLYMRARYYNPFICRFINPDPSGFAGGLNFYAALNGNPVSYFDPTGLGALGDNQTASWINSSSGTPADLTDPFALNSRETYSQPCIQCHGMSAFGSSGDVTAFSGLTTIPGVTPDKAAIIQNYAIKLQQEGPESLGNMAVAEMAFLTALGASSPGISPTTTVSTGINLAEGEASLVLMKNGQLVAQQPVASMLPHAEFAALNGAVVADGSLAPGFWVGTIGKVNGNVVAMNSMTFYGNQLPNATATLALRSVFH